MVRKLAVDYRRRRLTLGDEAVELTATEYELLRVLSLDAGRVVDFDTLLHRVWAKPQWTGQNRMEWTPFVPDARPWGAEADPHGPTAS